MAAPQQVSLPPGFTLSSGWVVRWVALDPTSGAARTDVAVSSRTIGIDLVSGDPGADLPVDTPWLVPVSV